MFRKIDATGRLCIPTEMRKKIDIDTNREVKIDLVGDKIIITNNQKEDSFNEIKKKIKSLNSIESNKEKIIDDIIEELDNLK